MSKVHFLAIIFLAKTSKGSEISDSTYPGGCTCSPEQPPTELRIRPVRLRPLSAHSFCPVHSSSTLLALLRPPPTEPLKPNSQCSLLRPRFASRRVSRASRRFGRLRPAALSIPQFTMKHRGKAPNTVISVKYDRPLVFCRL